MVVKDAQALRSHIRGSKFQLLEFMRLGSGGRGTTDKLFGVWGPRCSDPGNGYSDIFPPVEAQEGKGCGPQGASSNQGCREQGVTGQLTFREGIFWKVCVVGVGVQCSPQGPKTRKRGPERGRGRNGNVKTRPGGGAGSQGMWASLAAGREAETVLPQRLQKERAPAVSLVLASESCVSLPTSRSVE